MIGIDLSLNSPIGRIHCQNREEIRINTVRRHSRAERRIQKFVPMEVNSLRFSVTTNCACRYLTILAEWPKRHFSDRSRRIAQLEKIPDDAASRMVASAAKDAPTTIACNAFFLS
jgi:hypothetical protein